MLCSIDECGNQAVCRTWCPKHYRRWVTHGDPNILKSKRIDLIGRRFGFLEIISLHSSGGRFVKWNALCDCGTLTVVKAQHLLRKDSTPTQSCGCRNGLNNTDYGPQKVKWIYDRNAKDRGIEQNLTVEEIAVLIGLNCYYCGSEPSNELKTKKNHREINFKYNGIDRIDNNKSYEIENCIPCCKTCNFFKRNLTQEEFLAHILKISEYQSNFPDP